MRINSNVKIVGEKVILVPYKPEHVPLYHQWMTDPVLLELTASEPLTLEEEYENQKSWYEDPKKCTFIIYNKALQAMAGDVNLFFNDFEDEHLAEMEIMIAAEESRGKGLGKEAVLLMMRYGIEKLGVSKYCAKIGETNNTSRTLFGKLGYEQIGGVNVFQEVLLEYSLTPSSKDKIIQATQVYQESEYESNGKKNE